MAGPAFVFDHDPAHGQIIDVSPLVRRVTANNPSHFTFHGTGTYIVGRGEVAVIDPGPADANHIRAIVDGLDGEEITHIFITHTHSDHSPATPLLLEHCDATVLAYDPTVVTAPPADWFGNFFDAFPDDDDDEGDEDEAAEKHEVERESIDESFRPDVILEHGQITTGNGWTLEALHTPGHISNHLCFGLVEETGVFTGDHIMGWSTTVIPAPDGSLTDYMNSLDVLLERPDDRTYWPTHGAPITDPHAFVRALRDHRNKRTAQILACLDDGVSQVHEMVAIMYADKPTKLFKAAGLSVLSHLLFLADAGRVTTASGKLRPAEDWALVTGGPA